MNAVITSLAGMLMFCFSSNCRTGTNTQATMNQDDTLQTRRMAVAGQFYSADANELKAGLKDYFALAPVPNGKRQVVAVIAPHAGYIFSGEVAAAAIKQLDPEKKFENIFVIACSHRSSFGGGSVYSSGNYMTPLGVVKTNLEIARKLSANPVLSFDPAYHNAEHSLEVQVPFLQYHLKHDFQMVPVILGTQDPAKIKKVAEALKPYFTSGNLFVISTDFSHYPAYKDAVITDKAIADAIVTNKPERLINSVESCMKKGIDNLATGCCSWPAVLTLMYLTEDIKDIQYQEVMYKNSGDSRYGEKDRVVGYWALCASIPLQQQHEFSLSPGDKSELLRIARATIDSYLLDGRVPAIDTSALPKALLAGSGAFVTLKKSHQLRGCIGHFEADLPLYKIVQQMAIASSTQDYRFEAVQPGEMKNIDIEISVLTPMQRITDVDKIRLGTDGIYIKKGLRSGTFLPQVATETGWDLENFLGHCSRDKAGIGWDGWKDKDAEIYIYRALVFGE